MNEINLKINKTHSIEESNKSQRITDISVGIIPGP